VSAAGGARRFEGRVALVTGAASGIGRATALRLAGEGAPVAVVDRDGHGAEETVRAVEAAGGKAAAFACDVARGDEVARTVAAIEGALGAVDVLANVAGIGDTAGFGGIQEVTDERWGAILAVNLTGPFLLCRAILPGMGSRGRGAVVNVSSLAGRSKSANAGPAYSASKAGLLGLTRHLAFDYGRRGVRVNAICPGGVDTPMIRGAQFRPHSSEDPEDRRRRLEAYRWFMPIQRLSTPEEQAAAIAFLASDEASYINGVALDVNGGLYMA
jgi:NAD(P)-dependent dehydrogenase (short-subunit alcohol dehydrogenase family)